MSLGPYPEVSLAEARDKARERRKQIRDGINPLEGKHASRAQQEKLAYKKKTFAECATDVIEIKSKELKNKNTSLSGVPRWKPMLIHLLVKRPLAK
ncbi:hypothetical protein PPNK14_07050 [Pectobacterium parmentieri]|uniref:Integrase DNA-binding domain-containing protein n=1 Tax=Pectobacterium parmentieri TaxID=1905730 RepID=A0A0H3I5S9_PECPM|nr:Hypothetical protein W5S_2821 [Pectobacterium parmentieri]POW30690.1 integrase [Pectobacterium parmentieri]